MSEPILTPGDRQSAVWQKLKKYIDAQLEQLRKRNDGPLTNERTLELRGQIRALKALLSLGTDAPREPIEGGFED